MPSSWWPGTGGPKRLLETLASQKLSEMPSALLTKELSLLCWLQEPGSVWVRVGGWLGFRAPAWRGCLLGQASYWALQHTVAGQAPPALEEASSVGLQPVLGSTADGGPGSCGLGEMLCWACGEELGSCL